LTVDGRDRFVFNFSTCMIEINYRLMAPKVNYVKQTGCL